MTRSFKQYNPLYKLNMGLIRSEVFAEERSFGKERSFRYKRFSACMESFSRNYMRLERLLDRLAKDHNITYTKEDRTNVSKYQQVKDSMLLGNDLVMFFIVMKILLDDVAFFTPFYYRNPIPYGRKKKISDLRDSEWAWNFKQMRGCFFGKNSPDEEFASLLKGERDWIDEVCHIRNLLIHVFHDLSIDHDYWTSAYYAFLYEFNQRKDFMPNVLTYVAKIYYRFGRFLNNYEQFFKKRCEKQFPSFEYFYEGHTTAGGLNKTHLFFGGLGRILYNKILIRIHPNIRGKIQPMLENFLREENIACDICKAYDIETKPTVENFVLVSVKCKCGNSLPIPMIVEKKFYPNFMDKGRRNLRLRWGLIPYTLDKKQKEVTL